MNDSKKAELKRLLGQLEALIERDETESDLEAARRIAGEQSGQTGKNYQNFESGRYDHAFGVRTALAAIEYGRKTQ